MLSSNPTSGKDFQMRVTRVLLSAALISGLASAQVSKMANGPHDLRGEWTGLDQICVVCHAPHDSSTNKIASYGDLWNHTITTATFTLFGGQTGVSVGQTAADIDILSGACLSCHDGTVALGDFVNGSGKNLSVFISTGDQVPAGGWRVGGFDLGGTHPISMEMNNTRYTAATTNGFSSHSMGGPKNAKLRGGGSGHSIECYTCHNPHGTSTTTFGPLLRFSMSGSELCIRCHDNK